MEKIIYPVWKKEGQSSKDFREQMLGSMSADLLSSGVLRLTIIVADEAVDGAAQLRQQNINQPLMDAVISMWVDSAIYRQAQEKIIDACVSKFHGYLVTESEALVNVQHPADKGERVEGMCEVVFLQKPPRLEYQEWLDIWHNSHTQIAIDTQSTFGYRQNVVARALTTGAPLVDAIIEENFPAAAIHSQHAFYDAVDDDEKYQANQKVMIDSVVRFIDFDRIDVLPASEYIVSA
jgi:hypothetical protein